MRVGFTSVFFYTVMIGSNYCQWNLEQQEKTASHEPERSDSTEQRVRRQLASSQSLSTYKYIYYTDLLIEGYNSTAAEVYFTNSIPLPLSIAINKTLQFSVVQIYVTTECNFIGGVKSCSCKNGYSWNITVCYTYQTCSNSSFCSCILVPEDNTPFCSTPFNATKQIVNILGLFTLNTTFSKDLQDPTTTKYKALESNITLSLLNAYSSNTNLLSISVLGFRPGSVVASYKLAASAPISSSQLAASNAMAAGSLPNLVSSQISTTGIASIEPKRLTVRFWDPIQLTCQINETMTTVNWSLRANNNTNMIFSGRGNVAIATEIQSDSTTSTLIVNKADQLWQGTYICTFTNGSVVHEANVVVNVTLLPKVIILNPYQKTLHPQDTSQLVLECCVDYDGEIYNVSWTYNNMTVRAQQDGRADLECYDLVPLRPDTDTNYTCTFKNKAGQEKANTIPVTVIQVKDKFCSSNVSSGVTWNVTKAGVQAITVCPNGKYGSLTRDCSTDGEWMTVRDNCIGQMLRSALESTQTLEQGLGNSQVQVPQIIQQLATDGVLINNTAEVTTLVGILGLISNLSTNKNNTFGINVLTDFLMVASNLTDPTYSTFWNSENSPPASHVLKAVEKFSLLLQSDNTTFEIDLPNIKLKGSSYEKGCTVEPYQKTFDISLGVSTSIGKQTLTAMLEKDEVTITSVVFNTIGNLLPANTGQFNGTQLNSIVQSTSVSLKSGGQFSGDVSMAFGLNFSDNKYNQHCVFWDFTKPGPGGDWSDFGCTSRVERNMTFCSCNHLTSFAVLMSINVESLMLIDEITYVGLGFSIVSLCICILIERVVWKSVVRTNISYFRHTSLVNIALSLLFADICFLSSAFTSVKTQKLICQSITFLSHFFYLALFFWTLCQSVMLLHQLLFVFHHLRKRVFVSLSFFVGYFFPALIAAGTFLYFHPRGRYNHKTICWLNPESGAILAFAIPAGSIIVFNFATLLVVVSKLLRPSVSDANHVSDHETAKSIMKAIVVLTPVFGLTWSFGFALLNNLDDLTRQIFTYGFAGMNAFQGFFILITCCTEKKVREFLFNKVTSSPTSTITTSTLSTSDGPNQTPAISSIKKLK